MKSLIRYVMIAMMAVGFALPSAGAVNAMEKVAVLPIINNVEGDDMVGQIYIKEAIDMFNYPDYEFLENDALTAAIDAEKFNKEVPSEAALQRIAKASGADLVAAVVLDSLEDKPVWPSAERILEMDMHGTTVAYNAVTGKYYKHNFYDDQQIDETLTSRWDWKHDEFQKMMRREMQKITKM